MACAGRLPRFQTCASRSCSRGSFGAARLSAPQRLDRAGRIPERDPALGQLQVRGREPGQAREGGLEVRDRRLAAFRSPASARPR